MDTELIIGLIVIGIVLVVALLWYLGLPKCAHCGSKKMTRIDNKFLYEENITIKKTVEDEVYNTNGYVKEARPKEIIKRTVYVPGIREWYLATYKCNKCNGVTERKEYKDYEQ